MKARTVLSAVAGRVAAVVAEAVLRAVIAAGALVCGYAVVRFGVVL